jgi:hypothetical protein
MNEMARSIAKQAAEMKTLIGKKRLIKISQAKRHCAFATVGAIAATTLQIF